MAKCPGEEEVKWGGGADEARDGGRREGRQIGRGTGTAPSQGEDGRPWPGRMIRGESAQIRESARGQKERVRETERARGEREVTKVRKVHPFQGFG